MVKSTEEIALIKQGARVCDIGGAALVNAVHEGVPEYEVALASTQNDGTRNRKRFEHVELMDTWTWFSIRYQHRWRAQSCDQSQSAAQ